MEKKKGRNTLVHLFTSENPYVAKQMEYFMEATFYNYFLNNQPKEFKVIGVQADYMPVAALVGSDGVCPMYDTYVIASKKLEGQWGINLEFYTEYTPVPETEEITKSEEITLGGEDEL